MSPARGQAGVDVGIGEGVGDGDAVGVAVGVGPRGSADASGIGMKTTDGSGVPDVGVEPFQSKPFAIRWSLLQSGHGEGVGEGLYTRYATTEIGLCEPPDG